MSEFQVSKPDLQATRLVKTPEDKIKLEAGEILVKIDRFGFSANNITYGVAGDTLGYWKFFPPHEAQDNWGVVPVWGFADVIASSSAEITIGERLFGYFPPATHLVMKPINVASQHFFEGASHRAELPRGYNLYRRAQNEPGYDQRFDETRMLLYPLYLTSFALWDQMKDHHWYGAHQIILISASSKTSIGLAYALQADEGAPPCIGLTSAGNDGFVKGLGIYNEVINYQALGNIANVATLIVDMSGNADLLGSLHDYLGENMKKTLSVGLTHWESERRSKSVIKDRTEFFFAPSQIQKRMKEWGADEFNARSTGFVMDAAQKSMAWLTLETLEGLPALEAIFASIRDGKIAPERGLIVKL